MKKRIIYYISQTKISRDIKYKINNNYFNYYLINFNKKKKKLNSLEKKNVIIIIYIYVLRNYDYIYI